MRASTIFLRFEVSNALLGKKGNIHSTSLETPGGFQRGNKKWAKNDRIENVPMKQHGSDEEVA